MDSYRWQYVNAFFDEGDQLPAKYALDLINSLPITEEQRKDLLDTFEWEKKVSYVDGFDAARTPIQHVPTADIVELERA